jgi:Uncharacterised nucleotidyltransferase
MVPSPKMIGRGLTAATERFAAELAEPQQQAPPWTEFGWRMAHAAAVLHGVTPLLSVTLRWSGPHSWQEFMREQHRQTLLRHERITAALEAIDDRAKRQGLAAVALKGAALHALKFYVPGERPMADIDLLVQEADASRTAQLLASLGYVQTGAIWKHQMFEHAQSRAQAHAWLAAQSCAPLGEHANYPVKIELHTRIAEKLPRTEVDITGALLPLRPRPGLNAYPSTNALLLHLLLHAAGNICGRQLRLMHLHDLARLAARMTAADWQGLLGMLPAPHAPWWALPPLQLLSRYQPALVPVEVLAALGRACPGWLRRQSRHANLSQMSFASVSIPAFPGLVWCTSHAERLHYVRERIFPGAEQMVSRRHLATEQWAMQRSWTHMSQVRRVVHWLVGRPARQASMYIARAALQQPRA